MARSRVVPGTTPVILAESWMQAAIAAAALLAFALWVTLAQRGWPTKARKKVWFYPAIGFAISALVVLSASSLLSLQLRNFAWGSLLVMAAVWLHALDPLPANARGAVRFAKGVGVLALALGVGAIALALGWRGLAAPGPMNATVPPSHRTPTFDRIPDLPAFESRVRSTDRITMLDFYADWCVSCKEMERFTFSDSAVAERMGRMQLLQADVTRNTSSDKELLQRFGLFGPPGILFFRPDGTEIRSLRVIGYQDAAKFRRVLDAVLSDTSPRPGH